MPTAQSVGAAGVALLQEVNVPFGAVIPARSLAGTGRLLTDCLYCRFCPVAARGERQLCYRTVEITKPNIAMRPTLAVPR
jgi:hypothetical protein